MMTKPPSPYDAMPWLKHYDAGVPHNLDAFEPANICTLLDTAAKEQPDALAVIFRDYRLTYAQLLRQAEIMAANLAQHGVRPGDRVAIMMPNVPQIIPTFWAVLKAGGTVVMTNPLYMETELLHQMTDGGVRHLISIAACWPKLNAMRFRLGVEKFFITDNSEMLGWPKRLLYKFTGKKDPSVPEVEYDNRQVFPYAALLQGSKRLCAPYGDPNEQLALLQYTGGTTGTPKGVMLTHANQSANVTQTVAVLQVLKSKPQVFAALLPIFHVYGLATCLLLPTILRAACVMIPRYDPGEFLGLIAKHKITVFPGAPSVYLSLLQHKDFTKYDISSLSYGISGSAPIPAASLEKFQSLSGCKLLEGYGLTESSPITHLTPAEGMQKFGAIGVPLPGTRARIVDMDVGIIEMPAGEPGELIIKGPQIMSGYYNRPDETAGALRNGWLYTGDIAYMDEDGYFYIIDRKKDMAIVGGYNVYPREIDEVLLDHPGVKEAVSVALAHPTRGEMVKAFVVLKDGVALTGTDIVKYCRQRLAGYKVPRQVEFRDALPRAATGKILRRTLQAEEMAKYEAERIAAETARDAAQPQAEKGED
ncbi:Long-chain-fatty-acid--CoA ligase [uncultured delta proteobacterium]|uniref:Long-chain-fatty-acid--CoA ligase n=1 Tax=uncultured delta proteobacterium TaxID=34034 RepID=A0A212IU40_9DELT|nr:Long-chain-fatty-acid--CoA ligase [uncultured delta proteobacterium]